ncbi:MAG: AAA family ATPase [bacterium]|nr:AAA family ATPase [bacterium]
MTEQLRPRALALVGMAGAGKTLCAKHLEQRGFFQFRFGSIVTDEVTRRGWQINPENERIVREQFRREEGMAAIARRALPHLQAALQTRECIVIDGLYSFSEYKFLRPELGDSMVVVTIAAPRWLRYERLASRVDRPLTREQAEERDVAEIEYLEKGGPIAIADYTLINDGEADLLLRQLDALLEKLGLKP